MKKGVKSGLWADCYLKFVSSTTVSAGMAASSWPCHLVVATAEHAYTASDLGTISVQAQQVVLVQGDRVAEAPAGWVYCIIESGERMGLVPSNYLSIAVSP